MNRQTKGVALISALVFLFITSVLVGTAMFIGAANRRLSADNYLTTQAQYAAESGVDHALHEVYSKVLADVYRTNPQKKGYLSLKEYRNQLDDASIDGKTLLDGDSIDFGQVSLTDGASFTASVTRRDDSDQTVFSVEATGQHGRSKRRIRQDLKVFTEFEGDPFALLSNNVNCIFCHTTVTSIEAAYGSNNTPLKALKNSGLNNAKDRQRIRVATLESLNVDRAVDSVIAGTVYTRGETNLLEEGGVKTLALQTEAGKEELLNSTATDFSQENCGVSCDQYGNFYTNYPKAGPDGNIPDKFPLPVPDTNGNRQIDNSEWASAVSSDLDKGYITGGINQISRTGSFDGTPGSLSNATDFDLNSSNNSRGTPGHVVLQGTAGSPLNIQGNVYIDGDVVISGKVTGNGKIVARGNVYIVGDIGYGCGADGTASCDYSKPDTLPRFALVAGGNMTIGSHTTPATGDQGWTGTYEKDGENGVSCAETNGNGYCEYVKENYASDYFDKALTDTTSLSPEFIDPGRYLRFYNPDDPTQSEPGGELDMLNYFGATNISELSTTQMESYARATQVRCDTHNRDRGETESWSDFSARDCERGKYRTRASFTANEMAAFNQREYCKAASTNRANCGSIGYIAGYTPRFYRLRDGAEVYRCPAPDPSDCRTYGDETKGNDATEYDYFAGANSTIISSADIATLGGTVLSASPTASWLKGESSAATLDGAIKSELALKKMWVDNVESSGRGDKPLQIDGSLYSANAIFAIGPTRSRTEGSVTVNGSIIGADLGVLVTGDGNPSSTYMLDNTDNDNRGLRIHYDKRLNGLLGLETDQNLKLERSNFEQLRVR